MNNVAFIVMFALIMIATSINIWIIIVQSKKERQAKRDKADAMDTVIDVYFNSVKVGKTTMDQLAASIEDRKDAGQSDL